MNDVLPKPFTKEGMLRTLEKHLVHLKRGYNPQVAGAIFSTPTHPGVGNNAPLNLNMSHVSGSLKDENSPANSPAKSWHSPSQIGTSPQMNGGTQHYGQPMSGGYALTPAHPQGVSHFQTPPNSAIGPGPMGGPMVGGTNGRVGLGGPGTHRRGLSDMSDMINPEAEHPDVKRQRMYPPQGQGNFTQ
jgi:osomolarity two-component system response regulator SKN7